MDILYIISSSISLIRNYGKMKDLKAEGKIDKIGFSLYNTDQLQYLLDNEVVFDVLQFPYNLFDRQFDTYLLYLKQCGVEIHTRSVFLQGLFKNVRKLTDKLLPMKNIWRNCMNIVASVVFLWNSWL